MTTVNVYLTFQGNCEEAFNFYKSVFKGEFSYISRFKEMPQEEGKSLNPEEGEKIMHMSLPIRYELDDQFCNAEPQIERYRVSNPGVGNPINS